MFIINSYCNISCHCTSTSLTKSSVSSAVYGLSDSFFVIILAILYAPFAIIDLSVQISKLTKNKMKKKSEGNS